jgi:hypothetical protein
MKQRYVTTLLGVIVVGSGICRAGELNLNVILSGQVAPGVYGQVRIGNESPPPVVYAQPVTIEPVPYAVPPPPIYIHIPPDHALHWREHCREYHACNRPVYFVRSAEYEPDYRRRDHDDYRHDHDDHDHGRGHHEEGDRD